MTRFPQIRRTIGIEEAGPQEPNASGGPIILGKRGRGERKPTQLCFVPCACSVPESSSLFPRRCSVLGSVRTRSRRWSSREVAGSRTALAVAVRGTWMVDDVGTAEESEVVQEG